MGDPLTRPAEKVALEARRKLVTIEGARSGYGVVVSPEGFAVNEAETDELRTQMRLERAQLGEAPVYDRGGSIEELSRTAVEETGLQAPSPQWEVELYGPHVGLEYVQNWYAQMKQQGGWALQ